MSASLSSVIDPFPRRYTPTLYRVCTYSTSNDTQILSVTSLRSVNPQNGHYHGQDPRQALNPGRIPSKERQPDQGVGIEEWDPCKVPEGMSASLAAYRSHILIYRPYLHGLVHDDPSQLTPVRQRLTLPLPSSETNNNTSSKSAPKPTVLAEDTHNLADYGIKDSGSEIKCKDLGPQIAWTTVFLAEYVSMTRRF